MFGMGDSTYIYYNFKIYKYWIKDVHEILSQRVIGLWTCVPVRENSCMFEKPSRKIHSKIDNSVNSQKFPKTSTSLISPRVCKKNRDNIRMMVLCRALNDLKDIWNGYKFLFKTTISSRLAKRPYYARKSHRSSIIHIPLNW